MEKFHQKNQNVSMAKVKTLSDLKKLSRPRHFIREWRRHRDMSQEELAAAIGVTTGSISHLETGKMGFTQATLEALATALNCQPADLIMRNPLDTEAIWSLWESAAPNEKAKIIEMMNIIIEKKSA